MELEGAQQPFPLPFPHLDVSPVASKQEEIVSEAKHDSLGFPDPIVKKRFRRRERRKRGKHGDSSPGKGEEERTCFSDTYEFEDNVSKRRSRLSLSLSVETLQRRNEMDHGPLQATAATRRAFIVVERDTGRGGQAGRNDVATQDTRAGAPAPANTQTGQVRAATQETEERTGESGGTTARRIGRSTRRKRGNPCRSSPPSSFAVCLKENRESDPQSLAAHSRRTGQGMTQQRGSGGCTDTEAAAPLLEENMIFSSSRDVMRRPTRDKSGSSRRCRSVPRTAAWLRDVASTRNTCIQQEKEEDPSLQQLPRHEKREDERRYETWSLLPGRQHRQHVQAELQPQSKTELHKEDKYRQQTSHSDPVSLDDTRRETGEDSPTSTDESSLLLQDDDACWRLRYLQDEQTADHSTPATVAAASDVSSVQSTPSPSSPPPGAVRCSRSPSPRSLSLSHAGPSNSAPALCPLPETPFAGKFAPCEAKPSSQSPLLSPEVVCPLNCDSACQLSCAVGASSHPSAAGVGDNPPGVRSEGRSDQEVGASVCTPPATCAVGTASVHSSPATLPAECVTTVPPSSPLLSNITAAFQHPAKPCCRCGSAFFSPYSYISAPPSWSPLPPTVAATGLGRTTPISVGSASIPSSSTSPPTCAVPSDTSMVCAAPSVFSAPNSASRSPLLGILPVTTSPSLPAASFAALDSLRAPVALPNSAARVPQATACPASSGLLPQPECCSLPSPGLTFRRRSSSASSSPGPGVPSSSVVSSSAGRRAPFPLFPPTSSLPALDRIRTLVRVRPLQQEEQSGSLLFQISSDTRIKIQDLQQQLGVGSHDYVFDVDKVFGPTATQEEVWQHVSACVEKAVDGYNCTIFAHGQTGTGKTYTMLGSDVMEGCSSCETSTTTASPPAATAPAAAKNNSTSFSNDFKGLKPLQRLQRLRKKYQQLAKCIPELMKSASRGIIPRACELIFEQIKHTYGNDLQGVKVFASYIQIYNEKLIDLLAPPDAPASPPLSLVTDPQNPSSVVVKGLQLFEVRSSNELLQLLLEGTLNRVFRATGQNGMSSRSHAIFQVEIRRTMTHEQQQCVKTSRLILVDLAGNERYEGTRAAEKAHMAEMGAINRSLSILTLCIQQLARGERVVSFRSSNLTRLLRESLGGRCWTIFICTVTPAALCMRETLATLRLAVRAKSVKVVAKLNEPAEAATAAGVCGSSGGVEIHAVAGGWGPAATGGTAKALQEEILLLKRVLRPRSGKIRTTCTSAADSSTYASDKGNKTSEKGEMEEEGCHHHHHHHHPYASNTNSKNNNETGDACSTNSNSDTSNTSNSNTSNSNTSNSNTSNSNTSNNNTSNSNASNSNTSNSNTNSSNANTSNTILSKSNTSNSNTSNNNICHSSASNSSTSNSNRWSTDSSNKYSSSTNSSCSMSTSNRKKETSATIESVTQETDTLAGRERSVQALRKINKRMPKQQVLACLRQLAAVYEKEPVFPWEGLMAAAAAAAAGLGASADDHHCSCASNNGEAAATKRSGESAGVSATATIYTEDRDQACSPAQRKRSSVAMAVAASASFHKEEPCCAQAVATQKETNRPAWHLLKKRLQHTVAHQVAVEDALSENSEREEFSGSSAAVGAATVDTVAPAKESAAVEASAETHSDGCRSASRLKPLAPVESTNTLYSQYDREKSKDESNSGKPSYCQSLASNDASSTTPYPSEGSSPPPTRRRSSSRSSTDGKRLSSNNDSSTASETLVQTWATSFPPKATSSSNREEIESGRRSSCEKWNIKYHNSNVNEGGSCGLLNASEDSTVFGSPSSRSSFCVHEIRRNSRDDSRVCRGSADPHNTTSNAKMERSKFSTEEGKTFSSTVRESGSSRSSYRSSLVSYAHKDVRRSRDGRSIAYKSSTLRARSFKSDCSSMSDGALFDLGGAPAAYGTKQGARTTQRGEVQGDHSDSELLHQQQIRRYSPEAGGTPKNSLQEERRLREALSGCRPPRQCSGSSGRVSSGGRRSSSSSSSRSCSISSNQSSRLAAHESSSMTSHSNYMVLCSKDDRASSSECSRGSSSEHSSENSSSGSSGSSSGSSSDTGESRSSESHSSWRRSISDSRKTGRRRNWQLYTRASPQTRSPWQSHFATAEGAVSFPEIPPRAEAGIGFSSFSSNTSTREIFATGASSKYTMGTRSSGGEGSGQQQHVLTSVQRQRVPLHPFQRLEYVQTQQRHPREPQLQMPHLQHCWPPSQHHSCEHIRVWYGQQHRQEQNREVPSGANVPVTGKEIPQPENQHSLQGRLQEHEIKREQQLRLTRALGDLAKARAAESPLECSSLQRLRVPLSPTAGATASAESTMYSSLTNLSSKNQAHSVTRSAAHSVALARGEAQATSRSSTLIGEHHQQQQQQQQIYQLQAETQAHMPRPQQEPQRLRQLRAQKSSLQMEYPQQQYGAQEQWRQQQQLLQNVLLRQRQEILEKHQRLRQMQHISLLSPQHPELRHQPVPHQGLQGAITMPCLPLQHNLQPQRRTSEASRSSTCAYAPAAGEEDAVRLYSTAARQGSAATTFRHSATRATAAADAADEPAGSHILTSTPARSSANHMVQTAAEAVALYLSGRLALPQQQRRALLQQPWPALQHPEFLGGTNTQQQQQGSLQQPLQTRPSQQCEYDGVWMQQHGCQRVHPPAHQQPQQQHLAPHASGLPYSKEWPQESHPHQVKLVNYPQTSPPIQQYALQQQQQRFACQQQLLLQQRERGQQHQQHQQQPIMQLLQHQPLPRLPPKRTHERQLWHRCAYQQHSLSESEILQRPTGVEPPPVMRGCYSFDTLPAALLQRQQHGQSSLRQPLQWKQKCDYVGCDVRAEGSLRTSPGSAPPFGTAGGQVETATDSRAAEIDVLALKRETHQQQPHPVLEPRSSGGETQKTAFPPEKGTHLRDLALGHQGYTCRNGWGWAGGFRPPAAAANLSTAVGVRSGISEVARPGDTAADTAAAHAPAIAGLARGAPEARASQAALALSREMEAATTARIVKPETAAIAMETEPAVTTPCRDFSFSPLAARAFPVCSTIAKTTITPQVHTPPPLVEPASCPPVRPHFVSALTSAGIATERGTGTPATTAAAPPFANSVSTGTEIAGGTVREARPLATEKSAPAQESASRTSSTTAPPDSPADAVAGVATLHRTLSPDYYIEKLGRMQQSHAFARAAFAGRASAVAAGAAVRPPSVHLSAPYWNPAITDSSRQQEQHRDHQFQQRWIQGMEPTIRKFHPLRLLHTEQPQQLASQREHEQGLQATPCTHRGDTHWEDGFGTQQVKR